MKLAIVGGRTFNNYDLMCQALEEYCEDMGMPILVVSGGAKGADTLGERWAKENGIKTLILKPDWSTGSKAGLNRNTDIVNASTHVIAFVMPESRGTWDTIRKARKSDKNVKIIKI